MSNAANFPLLSLILFTPLVGAVLLLFVSRQNENAIKWIANVFGALGFLVSVPLWFWYNPQNPEYQFVERATWIPSIGADYFLGVDGFSVLLILLTTLMGVIAILSSWAAISERVEGKVRLADQKPPSSFRMVVEGSGKIGFVKGDGILTLTPKDGGTEVAYDGDAQVGGTMAAVGQRLIDATAKMMIKRFFENLRSVEVSSR